MFVESQAYHSPVVLVMAVGADGHGCSVALEVVSFMSYRPTLRLGGFALSSVQQSAGWRFPIKVA
jgi:hypothetical protein